jgi:hypothetical protein
MKIGKTKARFTTRDGESNVGAIKNAAAFSSSNV